MTIVLRLRKPALGHMNFQHRISVLLASLSHFLSFYFLPFRPSPTISLLFFFSYFLPPKQDRYMSCPQGIYVKGNSDIEVRSSEIMMINAMQAAVTENNREDHPPSGGIREDLSEWQTSQWRPKGGGRTSYGRSQCSQVWEQRARRPQGGKNTCVFREPEGSPL